MKKVFVRFTSKRLPFLQPQMTSELGDDDLWFKWDEPLIFGIMQMLNNIFYVELCVSTDQI